MLQLPTVLYKYIDSNGAEAFLQRPQIQFSDWRYLDDLMESVPGFRALKPAELDYMVDVFMKKPENKLSADKVRFFYETMNSAGFAYVSKEWRKLSKEQEHSTYVCSTSRRFNSGPMWSNYAASHRGLVFGFKPTAKCLQGKLIFRVKYAKNRPKIPFPLVETNEMLKLLVTKSLHWKYQAEWRIMSQTKDPCYLEKEELSEIIVGERANEKVWSLAMQLKQSGVPVFSIGPHPSDYRLTKQPFEPILPPQIPPP